jgi:hypothetical protein
MAKEKESPTNEDVLHANAYLDAVARSYETGMSKASIDPDAARNFLNNIIRPLREKGNSGKIDPKEYRKEAFKLLPL